MGIDLGQRQDFTAICVTEQQTRLVEKRPETCYHIRYLSRIELGTPYPAVAKRVAEIVTNVRARQVGKLTVYADATGVGLPVVDLLKAAGVPVIPCLFNHGDKRKAEKDEHRVSIGKAWLVSRLQALLASGCILLPKTEDAALLAEELINFEIRLSEDADFKAGAFKVGTHDDLVTALGLAVQDTTTTRPFSSATAGAGERPVLRFDNGRLSMPRVYRPRW
jgi:hypothetical protein